MIFHDIGSFSTSIGAIAVTSDMGYGVAYSTPSMLHTFTLSNPSTTAPYINTTAGALDAMVYNPSDSLLYAQSDLGGFYTYTLDGVETYYGVPTGLGFDGVTMVGWGSHGDLAIAPNSSSIY